MRLKTERKDVADSASARASDAILSAEGAVGGGGGDSTVEQLAQSAGLTSAPFTALSPDPVPASSSATAAHHDSSSGAVASDAPPGVSLARLEILLDASYTYSQAHDVVRRRSLSHMCLTRAIAMLTAPLSL